MTKQEIKKAIENGESVWVVYNSFLPYKLVMEENLTKEYSIEPYYLKEQKWALLLKNRYICDIDRVYKTKAEASIGHKKWVEFTKAEPKKAYSIQLEEWEEF